MKNYFSKFVLVVATAMLFQSCSGLKKQIDAVNPLAGSMTCKLDGTAWSATTVQVIANSTLGQLISVGGVSISAKNSVGLNFDLQKGKVEAGKTYPTGNGTLAEITSDTNSNAVYYSTDEPSNTSGSVTVTTWDGKTMTGSFSGTLYDSKNKKKIVITEGKFSGKVIL